jgi:hypothetical protein
MLESENRAEVKRRLQAILDELDGPSFLRIQRAMQALALIDNAEANALLDELGKGHPDSMLTREAKKLMTQRRIK